MYLKELLTFIIFIVILATAEFTFVKSERNEESSCEFVNSNSTVANFGRGVDIALGAPLQFYYIPMASKVFYRKWYEAILGKPVISLGDYSNFCISLSVSMNKDQNRKKEFMMEVNGFSHVKQNSVRQVCKQGHDDDSDGLLTCKTISNKSFKENPNENIRMKIAWTDSKKTVLLTRCISSNQELNDWSVLSSLKIISSGTWTKIRTELQILGFDLTQIDYMPYDGCRML